DGNCGLVCGDFDKIDASGRLIDPCVYKRIFGKPNENDFSIGALIKKPKVYGGTSLIARTVAEKIFPLPDFLSHEDWYIGIRAAELSCICYLDAPVIGYRMHPQNTSGNTDSLFYRYSKWLHLETRELDYYQYLLRFCEAHGIDDDYVKFKLKKVQLLKDRQRAKQWFKLLTETKGIKNKLVLAVYLFPYCAYLLGSIKRMIHRITKAA
ncbi:MAG TPA: hypothetical protein VLJ10_00955, partial [Candidatus Bathyarchaeia archaeon]|nr:hypothetical protein [Candidatus Bathyarchaeia archaeon]